MEKTDRKADKRHPMKVVVRRTGLTAHVVRVWERRYSAIEPARTPTNRRLYSDADIERLLLLRQATQQGQQIGRIACLPLDELEELAHTDPAPPSSFPPLISAPGSASPDPASFVERCIEAVARLDAANLEEELARAAVVMSRKHLLEELIIPLMHRTGELWEDGTLRVAHEHLASAAVRNFLGSMRASDMIPQTAPGILITTPAGQLHEIGALLAATVASSEGWRVTYLGPNLPAEEIAGAALQEQTRAVGLSIVYPGDDPHLAGELVKLRRALGSDIAILIGGRAAAAYGEVLERVAAVRIDALADLPGQLDALRTASSA